MNDPQAPTAYPHDDDEGAAIVYLAATGLAFQGHGKLVAIGGAMTAAGGSVDVYDGINANGRLIWSHRDFAGTGQRPSFEPLKSVRIDQGIWVVITNALVSVAFCARAYLRKELE